MNSPPHTSLPVKPTFTVTPPLFTTVPVSSLRQNGYAMIDGHLCKIVAMTTSRA